jgi:hypothetical protein
MSTSLRLLACTFVTAVVSTAGAQAASARVSMGLYTCFNYQFTYTGAITLSANGRYGFAYGTRGGIRPIALVNPKYGGYRASGARITFSGGPLASFYAVPKTTTKFALWLKGAKYPYSWCNWKS